MKHIVFLMGYYYPYYSAVGKCLGNVVEVLEKKNRVTVICWKTKEGENDEEHHLNHDIIRISTNKLRRRELLEVQIKRSKGLELAIAKKKLIIHKAWKIAKILLSKETIDKNIMREYLKALEKIDDIDMIIPTCTPFESVVAAMEYKSSHNSVKIIPYLFDMFSVSSTLHFFKLNRAIKMKRHLFLEKQMVIKCEKILHVPSWTKHFNDYFVNFKEKFYEVEHPLIKKMEVDTGINFDNRKINIVYTGVVDKVIRSPEYALQLFSTLFNEIDNIVLHFFVLGNAVDIIDKYKKVYPGRIINHGRVASSCAYQAMTGSTVLLSIGNTDLSQIPSKTFEYISCCKPIIHVANVKDDPVLGILNKYPLSFSITFGEESMEVQCDKIKTFLNNEISKTITYERVQAIYKDATPEYAAQMFG